MPDLFGALVEELGIAQQELAELTVDDARDLVHGGDIDAEQSRRLLRSRIEKAIDELALIDDALRCPCLSSNARGIEDQISRASRAPSNKLRATGGHQVRDCLRAGLCGMWARRLTAGPASAAPCLFEASSASPPDTGIHPIRSLLTDAIVAPVAVRCLRGSS